MDNNESKPLEDWRNNIQQRNNPAPSQGQQQSANQVQQQSFATNCFYMSQPQDYTQLTQNQNPTQDQPLPSQQPEPNQQQQPVQQQYTQQFSQQPAQPQQPVQQPQYTQQFSQQPAQPQQPAQQPQYTQQFSQQSAQQPQYTQQFSQQPAQPQQPVQQPQYTQQFSQQPAQPQTQQFVQQPVQPQQPVDPELLNKATESVKNMSVSKLVWSLIIFWPIGIVALIFFNKAKSALSKNPAETLDFAESFNRFCRIAFMVGVFACPGWLLFLFIFRPYSERYRQRKVSAMQVMERVEQEYESLLI